VEVLIFLRRRYVSSTIILVLTAKLLLGLASIVILGSESHGALDIIARSDVCGGHPEYSVAKFILNKI
jgi:hypothetical protein